MVRPLTPAQKRAALLRRRTSKRTLKRPPKMRTGTIVPYTVAGRRVRAKIIRQTGTGRVTIRTPDGKLRSVFPDNLR